MANASEPVIRVEGVQKSFGANHVLRGVDFEVMPGEVVTIIGASGSGKSTLLRCINLLETPDAGHVWFHGEDLAAEHVNVNRLRESIGMVFQGFNLFNNMNVMENCVLAPVTLKKCSRAEAEERNRRNRALKKERDRLRQVEKALEPARKRYDELMNLMADEALYNDSAKFDECMREYTALSKKIPALEEEWLELSEKLEEAANA